MRPASTLLFTSMSQTAGIRVREVPVRGIFRFRQSNPQLDYVSLMDITNARALAGMNLSSLAVAELTEREAALFGAVDEEDLFGGAFDELFGGAGRGEDEASAAVLGRRGALGDL